jgi:nicotinamidase-related amidase
MPRKSPDLHGNAPDESPVALLLIDLVNDLEFDVGEALLRTAIPAAERVAALKRRAKAAAIPAVYVNDNFGRWRSDLHALVRHCLEDGVRGRPVVERILPEEDDYFVLKPKHSGFYCTTLELLLEHFQTHTLVLTGLAAENCVLATAIDAHMRDFRLVIPRDCTASADPDDHRRAVAQYEQVYRADTRPEASLDLAALVQGR